ncbi:MAG: hypothetical protein KDD40_08450, partial [Bdellovibrionales bacterium]|nr:hypothetical protein [Bdellovibrionales bacterium]
MRIFAVSLPWHKLGTALLLLIFVSHAVAEQVFDRSLVRARRVIEAFESAADITEANQNKLILRTKKLSNYKFRESEEALINRLMDEVEYIELSHLNFLQNFLEVLIESLRNVATLRISNEIHEVIESIGDHISSATDETQIIILQRLSDKLRRTQIEAEKRKEYDEFALYSDFRDKDKSVAQTTLEKNDPARIQAEIKKQQSVQRREQRKDKYRRLRDIPNYDVIAEDPGRRGRFSEVKSAQHTMMQTGAEPKNTDEESDLYLDNSSVAQVLENAKESGDTDLLKYKLLVMRSAGSDATKTAAKIVAETTTEFFSDGRISVRKHDKADDIYNRDVETETIIDILMRETG